MKFCELEENEYRNFLDKSPQRTFMQTPEMGKIREKSGWKVVYLGVKEDDKVVAASMFTFIARYFGKKEYYAPRGLLIDYQNKELVDFFTDNLKKYVKEHDGYVFRIDPYVINVQRNSAGEIVEGGIDNRDISKHLQSLGYKTITQKDMKQVKWMYVLDVKDKSEEELLKKMRSFTRRNIQKSIRNKIIVREAQYDELPLVKEILDSTCERKSFANRNLAYFQNMYNFFNKNDVKFIIAEIDVNSMLDELNKQKAEIDENIRIMIDQKAKEEKISKAKENLERVEKQIIEVQELKNQYGDIIPASSGVFMTFGYEVVYLFGGNKKEFMHFGTAYAIQWHMIKYAMTRGFERYNFYGISGNFDKNDKDYGVYDFKVGFNGYVEELIGEFVYPLSAFYYLIEFINKIKRH